jgi:hypothetical protein
MEAKAMRFAEKVFAGESKNLKVDRDRCIKRIGGECDVFTVIESCPRTPQIARPLPPSHSHLSFYCSSRI